MEKEREEEEKNRREEEKKKRYDEHRRSFREAKRRSSAMVMVRYIGTVIAFVNL